MDMTGERRIPAPRQTVWEALNNPEVLKSSIPGCESLEKTGDDQMKATAAIKVGPISARFNGKVQLTDINPPTSYRISGEGQGGVAGFAKGGANVSLADDGADTLLSYQVNAQVGGKLAQLGGRLIDATAKQMADAFFDRFSKQVQAMAPATEPEPAMSEAAMPGSAMSEPVMPEPVMQEAHEPAEATAGATMAPSRRPIVVGQHQQRPTEMPDAQMPTPIKMPAISIWSLIPKEPFGLPLAAWLGGGVFLIMVLLMLGSML